MKHNDLLKKVLSLSTQIMRRAMCSCIQDVCYTITPGFNTSRDITIRVIYGDAPPVATGKIAAESQYSRSRQHGILVAARLE